MIALHGSSGMRQVASGSVTQANMRISAVATGAFIDFSAEDVLTTKKGNLLEVSDSAGKKIRGYIKAAGTGETLEATERSVNGDFSSGDASWGKDGVWTIADQGGGDYEAVATAIAANKFLSQTYASHVVGRLYKTTLACTNYTSGGVRVYAHSNNAQGNALTGPGTSTVYDTATTSTMSFGAVSTAANTTLRVDDISQKAVLSPSATGVTISTTKGGSTQSWTSQETGFNYNDASGYTYRIFKIAAAPVVLSQAVTAGACHASIVNDQAFVFCDGVDLSPYGGTGQYRILCYTGGVLALDALCGLAGTGETLGTDVTNGSFAVDEDWLKAGSASIGGGVASFNGAGTLTQSGTAVVSPAGKLYLCVKSQTRTSGGSPYFKIGGYPPFWYSNSDITGTYSGYITITNPSSNNSLIVTSNNYVGTIDDVSVKQVLTPSTSGLLLRNLAGEQRVISTGAGNINAIDLIKIYYIGD